MPGSDRVKFKMSAEVFPFNPSTSVCQNAVTIIMSIPPPNGSLFWITNYADYLSADSGKKPKLPDSEPSMTRF